MEMQSNPAELPQPPSIPTDKLAKQLVWALIKNNEKIVLQLLTKLKNKKNPNHQSLSVHLDKQLHASKMEIQEFLHVLRFYSCQASKVELTDSQLKSIANGFKKYVGKMVNTWKIKGQVLQQIIDGYFGFEKYVCQTVCEIISKNFEKQPNEQSKTIIVKSLQRVIIEMIKNRKISLDKAQKCCTLIHQMTLYPYFKIPDLVHILRATNVNENAYFFKNRRGEILNQLLQAYIVKEAHRSQKEVKKLIQYYSLDPMDFPFLIKNLNKKCLRYLLRTQEIYQIDDKIKNRPDIAECLVEILIQEGKQKYALHFINKHYLSKFYSLNQTQDRTYNKNLLQKYDTLSPTQHILNKHLPNPYTPLTYLTLNQLNYKAPHFITSQNLTQQLLEQISNSPRFSIDSQSPFTYNQYESKLISIVQIAVDYQAVGVGGKGGKGERGVFVFDVEGLKGNLGFQGWVRGLVKGYCGEIVGHTVKKDVKDFAKQVLKVQDIDISKLKFKDIAEIFKETRNETKSSLEYICQKVLGKNLSKFQQCSGWGNRPLRQAQIHYAALDAVLPLVLLSKM